MEQAWKKKLGKRTKTRINFLRRPLPNPIPNFDANLVLPPHLGDPRKRDQLSPYPCNTVDLCERFGSTPERRRILQNFLNFRTRLRKEGLIQGFQWLDGSFLEDIETLENRPPRDLDVVTVFWGFDLEFQQGLNARFPEFWSPLRCKASYLLDHYAFDAGYTPEAAVEWTRYWIHLFSHNRLNVWKGMLKIELNTPNEDAAAIQNLANLTS